MRFIHRILHILNTDVSVLVQNYNVDVLSFIRLIGLEYFGTPAIKVRDWPLYRSVGNFCEQPRLWPRNSPSYLLGLEICRVILSCLNVAPLIPDLRTIIQKGILRFLVVNHFVFGLVDVHGVSEFSIFGHWVDLTIHEIVHAYLVSM